MARRSSSVHSSLNRPKLFMGVAPLAFQLVIFFASFLFAGRLYTVMPLALLMYLVARWLSKKEPLFADLFLRYANEKDVYGSLCHPSDWSSKPRGWGRGLAW
jgi:type IV secretory pathway TrbD component